MDDPSDDDLRAELTWRARAYVRHAVTLSLGGALFAATIITGYAVRLVLGAAAFVMAVEIERRGCPGRTEVPIDRGLQWLW